MKDATYWAKGIKNKEFSAEEVLKMVIKRAKAISGLNAFTKIYEEEAHNQIVSAINLKAPFYGVPIALKDMGQSKKGFIETSGSRLFSTHVSHQTNNYVKQIEEIGMIPFAVTNAPEFGFKNITDPSIHGVTKNAWNKDYHAGGSSGGAATVVASGVVPLAGASDGGGSIRIPASFSGLIGLKPSRGMVTTGPTGWRSWQGASVNFTLGISIRDARQILTGLKPTNQISPFLMPKENLPNLGRPLKIAVCTKSPVGNSVSEDAQQAVREAILFLESQGHEVFEIDYPINGIELINSYYMMNGGETSAMMRGISEQIKRPIIQSDMELVAWTLYQYGEKLFAADYAQSFSVWDQATFTMETLFNSFDLFLSPSATRSAPNLDEELISPLILEQMKAAKELSKEELAELVYAMFEKSLHITPYTQLANLTGQPGISLPIYIDRKGLPIGVQFMAAKGNDRLLLDVGELFEKHQKFLLPEYYTK